MKISMMSLRRFSSRQVCPATPGGCGHYIITYAGPSGRAPPPVPPPMEDIYEAAAADEEEQPPPLPPPSRPPVTQDNLEPTPPRPPKPGGSPALPHKATPLSLGSSRPSMRKPIGGGGGFAALRPPIQSSFEPRPPAPPTVPSVGDSRGTPPPPPPPPLISSQVTLTYTVYILKSVCMPVWLCSDTRYCLR